MADKDSGSIQTQGTQLLADIPFHALIANPLVAAVEAQGLASGATMRFILSALYGYDMTGSSGESDLSQYVQGDASKKEVLYVQLTYTKQVPGDPSDPSTEKSETVTLKVPLLILLPIPLLLIDNMSIKFTADIKSVTSTLNTTTTVTTDDGKKEAHFLWWNIGCNTGYSSKQTSTATAKSKYSVEYNMDVYVHATGDDMPSGLSKVLGMLSEGIQGTHTKPS